MAQRKDVDVLLPHPMADRVARLLAEYRNDVLQRSRTTSNPAVHAYALYKAQHIKALSTYITQRLYRWERKEEKDGRPEPLDA